MLLNWKGILPTVVILGLILASPALAQQKFRESSAGDGALKWKFEKGQKIKVTMNQTSESTMSVAGQNMDQSSTVITETSILVEEVDAKGTATQISTIDRMKMNMDVAGQSIKYDSNDKDPSDPSAKMIGDMLKTIIGAKITQKMGADGAISEVVVPDDALPQADPTNPISMMFTKDSLEEMAKGSAMAFPKESMKIGEKWSEKKDMTMGPMTITVDTDYSYLGVTDSNGKPLHVIQAKLKLTFPEDFQGAKIEMISDDATGLYYFDGNAGHLNKVTVDQKFKLEITAGPQVIEQDMTQKIISEFEVGK